MARRISVELEAKVVAAYRESPRGGHTLAGTLGIGATTLYRVLARNGVPVSEAKRHGRSVSRFSLTDEQQREVVLRHAAGERSPTLATSYGVCKETILDYLRRHGYKTPIGRPKRVVGIEDLARAADLAAKGWSQARIAAAMKVCQATVSKWLRMQGIERRPRRGIEHGAFKGGRYRLRAGYIQVLLPVGHPLRKMAMVSGHVLEHRLVMAEQIGRPLLDSESVHHINGKRDDNRPENLELRVGKHGKGIRLVCQACGSFDVGAVPLAPDRSH